jgi:6-pyruvoyltetrahydropterin/6-carboxytetrahydropterin synthase
MKVRATRFKHFKPHKENGHLWVLYEGGPPYPVCFTCGVVRRKDGKNPPCKGPVKVGPREKGTKMRKAITSVTRIFPFDAGHRIVGHESKCANLHGHGYEAHVTVMAPELDRLGRVIDFGCLKEIIGGWIDSKWDHNMILFEEDELIKMLKEHPDRLYTIFSNKAPYQMMVNPTAENMARELLVQTQVLLPKEIQITNIRLYETPKCFADVRFQE